MLAKPSAGLLGRKENKVRVKFDVRGQRIQFCYIMKSLYTCKITLGDTINISYFAKYKSMFDINWTPACIQITQLWAVNLCHKYHL